MTLFILSAYHKLTT